MPTVVFCATESMTLRERRWAPWMIVAASVVTTWSCEQEKEGVHWAYTGEAGPAHWGALSPEFKTCAAGQMQSPIDIANPAAAELGPVQLQYGGATTSMVNNGHAIQLNVEQGNWLQAGGKRANLAQIHLHSPSEHRIGGEHFPLEAHFVHAGEDGGLTVLGVLFRTGEADAALATIVSGLAGGASVATPVTIKLADFGPRSGAPGYFRYQGSLTTPPCTEGVVWYVSNEVKSASSDQIAALVRLTGENARPTQPLHGRQVLQSPRW